MEQQALLQAIEQMLESKLDSKLEPIHGAIAQIKEDVGILKEDVGILKEDVGILKEDSAITRSGTNMLLRWAEKADEYVVRVGLYDNKE